MRRFLAVAALLLLALSPAEERGRRIYRTGESASGKPITALVGAGDVEVPASVVPCASCHGRDGRGKEEGGVRPSNLQWDVLTKPYRVATPDGRTHPPYTPALVKRAVTMGIDPAKNRLNPAMPRYRMSIEDANDLVAYLRKLGSDADPGLTDDAVRIGVVLPPVRSEGAAVRETLAAYFEGINRNGGIFARRLEIADADEPFAVIDLAPDSVARDGVPTLATVAEGDSQYLFHVLAGIEEQSLALIGTLPTDAAVRILDSARTSGTAARLARTLGARVRADARTVLFLGDASALANLLASPAVSTILIPAPFTTGAIFSAPPAVRILVSLPASVADETPAGTAELRALAPPPITHRTSRAAALAAAKLLVLALRRAGRDIDRELLVSTLETFRREPTYLTPPVTWTPAHHTGPTQCTIGRVEGKGLVPLG